MAFTFFFRDLQMLELAIDYVAPELAERSRPKIWDAGCAYEESFAALEKICARDIRTIYFGHGAPLLADCNIRLQRSLEIVSKSVKRGCGLLNQTRKVNCEVV